MNRDNCLQFKAAHMTPCFMGVGQYTPCDADICVAEQAAAERLADIEREQSDLAEFARLAIATGSSKALIEVVNIIVDDALHSVCPLSCFVDGSEWQARAAEYYEQRFPLLGQSP